AAHRGSGDEGAAVHQPPRVVVGPGSRADERSGTKMREARRVSPPGPFLRACASPSAAAWSVLPPASEANAWRVPRWAAAASRACSLPGVAWIATVWRGCDSSARSALQAVAPDEAMQVHAIDLRGCRGVRHVPLVVLEKGRDVGPLERVE